VCCIGCVSCMAGVHGSVGILALLRLDPKMMTLPLGMIQTWCVFVCVFVGVLQ